ncbi:hypothetical protein AB0L26_15285 [Streptomyces nondiastaticus]|uniref:hypothetical protein n=1 Tax=Streptomyces TaxID=1883 RepID=UPI0026750F4E|nr:hypothetical protein [Streptomyces sp. VNUA116]WKU46594.1 hypothetical protein Q3V23_22465 [Streptomyces sp. VNUA116]
MSLHDVTLLHDNWPEKKPEYFAGLAADPPAGFTYSDKTWGYYPGVTGRREAPTQFHAIASVVAEVAGKHGVLLNDAGVEKPGEWLGDEWNQTITAHLLLAAVHRAAYCGLALDDLVDFLRSTAPAEKRAGSGSDVPD